MKMIYMNHTIQSGFFKAATKNFFAVAPGKVSPFSNGIPADGRTRAARQE